MLHTLLRVHLLSGVLARFFTFQEQSNSELSRCLALISNKVVVRFICFIILDVFHYFITQKANDTISISMRVIYFAYFFTESHLIYPVLKPFDVISKCVQILVSF